jgi:metal-responsive CopG/Arc/MetJ family transcriptional regulator
MGRTQSLVQLNDELLAALDQQAAARGRSRSDLIREAIEHYLTEALDAEIDKQIADGYRRVPQEEDPWTEILSKASIAEEPW